MRTGGAPGLWKPQISSIFHGFFHYKPTMLGDPPMKSPKG